MNHGRGGVLVVTRASSAACSPRHLHPLSGPWCAKRGVPAGLPFLSYANPEGRMVRAWVHQGGARRNTRFYSISRAPFSTLPAVPSKHPLSKDKLVTEEENPQSLTACNPGGRRGEGEEVLEDAEVPKEGLSTLSGWSSFDFRMWLCQAGVNHGHTICPKISLGCCACSDSRSASSPLSGLGFDVLL